MTASKHPSPAAAIASASEDTANRLLAVVRDLAIELNPKQGNGLRVSLDAKLDRDLGLDSLGRAELNLRLERAFGIALREELLAEAETPRDLLRAILAAVSTGGAPLAAAVDIRLPEAAASAPATAETLVEILDWHVANHGDRPHLLLSDGDGVERIFTYAELAILARAMARGLRQRGIAPGDRVAIMLPTGPDFFPTFFGILYAGAVPVPIYPPVRLAQIEEHLRRQVAILRNAGASLLVTVPEGRALAHLMMAQVEGLRGVETPARLKSADDHPLPANNDDQALALLQYTSGSTGDPKGVMLSHANLIANIRAMVQALRADSSDVFVSWLPLYHDMGLIGAWLGSLYAAVPVVIMSPLAFLTRPSRWLRTIERHRGTITVAPNFAFELCLRNITDAEIAGLNLSSLRVCANGAEAVSADTIRRFTARFGAHGFAPEAMAPVYGLAECSVGLAFPPLGRVPPIDRIRRADLMTRGRATPAAAGESDALELVGCGRPLPGHEIRIIDDVGREAPERVEGRLQFSGPSMTAGYYRNPEKTRELIVGHWRDSGDMAYIAGGDIHITGRRKDIIIRAGRNIYPEEIERAVGELAGVRKGCVAVFGSPDPASGTERLIVVLETRVEEAREREDLRRRVAATVTDILGAPPDEVALVGRHAVPKTSSGKLRRASARGLYESGGLDRRRRAWWWQLVRLGFAAAGPELGRVARATIEWIYAGWWWSMLALSVVVIFPAVLILPGRSWRWRVLRHGARAFLRSVGLTLTMTGREHLAAGGVIVANHASYIDGLVLAVALGGEPVFVVKNDLERQVFAGPFLRRLGALFVERVEAAAGVADTARAVALAQAGQRIVFFPEGVLTRVPGLLAFKLGAFVVAAQAGVAVAPIALRGTRDVLRGDQWFPRRRPIAVDIAPAILPDGSDLAAAIRLRDAARSALLACLSEPDLGHERARVTGQGIEKV